MGSSLTYRRVSRDSLCASQVGRMFELMRANYDLVSYAGFESDLSWKDEVLVLLDQEETIQGFSTLALNPAGTGTADYDVFYSGDTIIDPAHWGSQELVRGFCHAAGQISAERQKPLYWYLLSKGYRTYLYLPLFTHEYFPAPETVDQAGKLYKIADRCSQLLFGDRWKSSTGILQFPTSLGQLKPHHADDTFERAHHPRIAFFLERNPGFAGGDELVCLTELSVANTRRTARRYLIEGMEMAELPGTDWEVRS